MTTNEKLGYQGKNRKEELRRRYQEKEYNKLLGNDKKFNFQTNIKEETSSVSIGFGILSLSASLFAAGYFWAHYILGRSQQTGLIAGLACSVIIFFIEVILFIIRDTKANKS